MNNANPLVSICATFISSENHIHRIIESTLRQTYQNVELVLVDDASTDRSQEIIASYAAKDGRIKYVRNRERTGLIPSLKQCYENATGEFVVWLGADDWLARNSIAEAVKSFKEHPEAAAVAPRVFTLLETQEGRFNFSVDDKLPRGVYSAPWLAKYAYRGVQSAFCLLSLFRRKDALSAIDYFLEHCCYDPALPAELRKTYLQKAYAPDFAFFLEILSRYSNFVFNPDFAVIKVSHGANLSFGMGFDKASDILKSEYYWLVSLKDVYREFFPTFNRSMKIYTRAQALSTLLIYFLRSKLNPSFWDLGESRKQWSALFEDLSPSQKILAIILAIPRFFRRFLIYILRKLTPKPAIAPIFNEKYFLNAHRHFEPS